MEIINRPPYIKGKNYVVNPVVKFGIPKEADSRNYPSVIGTVAWEQYWNEQLYYIHNGYQTGGLWVSGRYYYYMNFTQMNTIERGVITADPTDLHLELANHIEYCKNNGCNLMIPKGRRRGISEATHSMVIDFGYRFSADKYQAGVAAGHSKPINDFITKWKFADTKLPPEFFTGRLTKNDDEIIAGWTEKNSLNTWEDCGTFNTIFTRTMHTDVNGFKGLYLNDVVVEEVGEFENFLGFWEATKDCLMSNQKQVGSMYVYGTGGNINKGSRDFKKAWDRTEKFCESNNFIRFVVDARRFYFYGGASLKQQQLPLESELLKKHKPYQLIGVEDIVLAEKDIKKRAEEYLKSGDIKGYTNFKQNNPITEAEIFAKTVVNNFDVAKLNEQQHRIDSLPHKKYSRWKFEFEKDKEGLFKMPLAVKAVPATQYDKDDECVLILDDEHPRQGIKNLYCAGLDSYDQDTSKTSKSLGAMCVMIRDNFIQNALKKAPVAIIRCRPSRKEKFYEMCLQLSIYYDLEMANLIDVRNPAIIQYFKDRGGEKYLAPRPRRIETVGSTQAHDYGLSLNNSSKPIMVGLMQTHIYDHVQDIWFPDLIGELGNYDEVEIGSDNDLADGYGICLIQDVASDFKPKDTNDELGDKRFDLGFGNWSDKREKLKTDEQDHALFGKL